MELGNIGSAIGSGGGLVCSTGSSAKNTNDAQVMGGNATMTEVKNILTSPHKIEIDGNFLRISPRKKAAGQNTSTNPEINFGDWIWSDVQKTPTKQSAN